ncbi:MAG: hypothetical protein A2X12_06120 [Bacteroidetes bacterium GWE2_29_8]|nr:MAG: hypothetical protein A2X12_06120 [Bacteroidetes bacterium GWE2_29_8]OFY24364.1 MAG: hypothetical protein A2X02_08205 [Bacteroidetes bacterium GWF2_29_10]
MSFYKNIHLNTVSGLKYITNNYHVLNTYSINNITYYLCVSNIEKDKESILKEIINNFIDSTSNFASNSSLMFSLTNGALLWFEDFFKLDITLACKSISYFYFDNVVLNSFISTPLKPPIL